MPKPLLWSDPETSNDAHVGQWDWRGSTHHSTFKSGHRLDPIPSPPTIVFEAAAAAEIGKFEMLTSTGLVPLLDERAATILGDAAGNDVQLIPARVMARDGEIGPFWLVNATRLVSCIDLPASSYTMIAGAPEKILGFRHLRLLADAMGDARVARESMYQSFLYVSSDLAATLRRANLRGLNLQIPEQMPAYWL